MNALNLGEIAAPQLRASPPLRLRPALLRFRAAIKGRIRRGGDEARQARREAALRIVEEALASNVTNTIATFEGVLNGSLDVGYRAQPLAAFVFDALHRRLASRARRRLASSGHDPDSAEVADLVASTAEAIQKLIRKADRERHTLRYALLLSITDHRTIDYLRRRRPEYRETMDDQAQNGSWSAVGSNPERILYGRERQTLAEHVRVAILETVNQLPESQRAALVMVEINGLGYPEIAKVLGVKRTDVGNLVRRARLNRDRTLAPKLRMIPGLEGYVGFQMMQTDRSLRTQMLGWVADMGHGVCTRCLGSYHVHPAEQAC